MFVDGSLARMKMAILWVCRIGLPRLEEQIATSKPLLNRIQTSVEVGSDSVKTLYSRLLMAGPILRSVRAPFLFADFLTAFGQLTIPLLYYW